MRRVLPVIRTLARRLPQVPISIDTTKSAVAEAALEAGASIINDISGLAFDPEIARIAARSGAPLVLMHLRGRPETMQRKPFARSVWRSVRTGLAASIRRALAAGIRRSQLILDPGLGFGKSRRQNFELLAHLDRLHSFRLPLLVGTSRKSFVQAIAAGEGLDAPKSGQRARSYWTLLSSERLASSVRALPQRRGGGGCRGPCRCSRRPRSRCGERYSRPPHRRRNSRSRRMSNPINKDPPFGVRSSAFRLRTPKEERSFRPLARLTKPGYDDDESPWEKNRVFSARTGCAGWRAATRSIPRR